MQLRSNLLGKKNITPIALYSSEQLYAMEQAWFAQGHDSFGLMQQAAWQMAQHIEQLYEQKYVTANAANNTEMHFYQNPERRASVWIGKGNNGGDGWLIAYYLQQAGWQVQVITVGFESHDFAINAKNQGSDNIDEITDAVRARQIALSADCDYHRFEDTLNDETNSKKSAWQADIYIDALFGIGLDRQPEDPYQQAIHAFNQSAQHNNALAIAIDIPSGLVASTGEVFERVAIQADVTLCLIARKFGLHTKDGADYSGEVIDIPLIPYQKTRSQTASHSDNNQTQETDQALLPIAELLTTAHGLNARRQNSYKGSYGHVLIIGGNRIDDSQGMGGAAILSASSTMAAGAGKITVACHSAFHGSLLTALPDAMTIDLHDAEGVKGLIKAASIIAIGMGLGRDKKAETLFISYIQAAITQEKPIVIDADGLYHLASLQRDNHTLIKQLREYSKEHQVCLTPHSGEAARLLEKKVSEIESDRLAAIKQCTATYGGDWVLKGAGSLILENRLEPAQVYVCGVGNAGMATAGMGDVLSGVIAGLLAQQDLDSEMRSLHQAAVIHGLAGDILVNRYHKDHSSGETLLVGQRGLQAQDMSAAIRHVMQLGLLSNG
ncbi:NAD(P)H-hydrate dehydratase [Psychrobacter sp. B38]|uniref:NAD(P)H-hydrate dehydratase n=1 Tax=Psychrobacter sp. B38 TaxID=3143538 RepID=UPI0032111DC8